MTSPPRALLFDAGNTLLRMDYEAIAAELRARRPAIDAAQVEEAEVCARVRLDPHLAPGASTESGSTHTRYLRYLLEHLGVVDAAEVDAVVRWRSAYNRPVGLWHLPEPTAAEVLGASRRRGWWRA